VKVTDMTRQERKTVEMEALQRLLESHGADRTRWPARDRLRFAQMIAEDAEARRLVAEATALDSLLELAPAPSVAREQEIGARILALAQAQPRAVETRPEEELRARPRVQRPGLRHLPAAALLAASLLVGIFAGTSGVIERLLDAAGLGRAADVQQATLDEEVGKFLDAEELL
jgi:hypothetical protein